MNKKDLSECDICTKFITPAMFCADYLNVFLSSSFYWEQLRDNSAGTGQPNVNGEALSHLLLPVPPLAEQRRIVAKVEKLLALCDELEARQTAAREHRTRLVRSALDHLTLPSRSSRRESALTETKPGKSLSGLTSAATGMRFETVFIRITSYGVAHSVMAQSSRFCSSTRPLALPK